MTSADLQGFSVIEETLRSHLRPYRPDPGFVNTLKHRLTTPPGIEIESPAKNSDLFLKAVLIISGLAAIFVILRILSGKK